MDKNEYNLKLEEIRKQIDLGNYAQAVAIADQIDWRKVRNVNTLCMISEVYEAENRYEDSKAILVRAYRRSPVGRTVLYRLVECTIALKQFDEAIEYYTEYVQAAPHDNNRFILKYKIYRGRGSSLDEQIDILREYLDQEYNEKYAYEQAKLFQQADRMEECIAACDDLVLWFHSGKYVIKALELKRRYAALTPKQQEIYDHRFDVEEEEELGQEMKMVDDAAAQTLTDTILEDTKKAIAQEVALAAGMQNEMASSAEDAGAAETMQEIAPADEPAEAVQKAEAAQENMQVGQEELTSAAAEDAGNDTLTKPAEDTVQNCEAEAVDASAGEQDTVCQEQAEEVSAACGADEEMQTQRSEKTTQELQEDVARDMRQIVGNVGRLEYKNEDEEAADEIIEESKQEQAAVRGLQNKLRMGSFRMPDLQKKQAAGKLSIDDILLSMGERGDEIRQAASKSEAASMMGKTGGVLSAVDEALLGIGIKPADLDEKETAVEKEEQEEQPEQAEEKLLSEKERERTGAQLAEAFTDTEENEQPAAQDDEAEDDEDADMKVAEDIHTGSANSDADKQNMEDIIGARTRVIPVEEIAREYRSTPITVEEDEDSAPAAQAEDQEELFLKIARQRAQMEEKELAFADELEQPVTEEIQRIHEEKSADVKAEAPSPKAAVQNTKANAAAPEAQPLMRPETEELFEGFLEVGNLRVQIASAITQAVSKGADKTSRTGNVLVFGGHGCGKTTLATALAKAIAAAQGRKFVKMARIYATDLNRKDIAATIAKIAGGVLIIEEAGDLEDNVADQMTTAMEFRTDGLIVILEDEQKYLHELLMRHPRLTMKFTSEIFIPELKPEELVNFAQIYADEKDYALSSTAQESLTAILANKIEHGDEVSITSVIEMVNQAIGRASTFGRKVFGGKKRFDESGRIILKEKDFTN